jgi:hypothetical protein
MPDQPSGVPADRTELRWRISPKLTALKGFGAAAFAVTAVVVASDPVRLALAGLAAALLAGLALRDVLAPVRLAADATGVTVRRGFLGRRHIAWQDIEAVRVDERSRLGARSRLVEIDGGNTLYLFSANDLNAECDDVVAALEPLRSAARR